ncbi:MAG: hypothetical protein KA170_00090 [Candidatus Promineofilum sp.]|nr:hypothetical protein [Promineifilum sp.]
MKITTPKGYVIELSAEEAETLFPGLVRGVRRQLIGLAEPATTAEEPPSAERLVRRVLRRHRIPPTQRAVYRALYEAGDDGLDFGALAAATGRTTEELSGVLGGLGRRVNATSGIETLAEAPGVNLLFEHRASAPPGGSWGWAMRPELRQALEDLGLPWE